MEAMIDLYLIKQLLLQGLILVASLSIHEWAHAFVADKLGDDLPRLQERVTLHPMAHIDFFGTLVLPLSLMFLAPGFPMLGWAKPVPICPENFKHPKWGPLFVSLAGPLANLGFAAACALGSKLLGYSALGPMFDGLFFMMVTINVSLAVFNLLPLPPLDGAVVLRLWGMGEERFAMLSQWSPFVVLLLLQFQPFIIGFQCLVYALSAILSA